jgi:hypothetical protein
VLHLVRAIDFSKPEECSAASVRTLLKVGAIHRYCANARTTHPSASTRARTHARKHAHIQ